MMVSVHCAFGTAGLRKSGMALLTASIPVIAVQPLAKARNSIQALTAWVAAEIVLCDNVGAATTRIRSRRLSIREVKRREQCQDCEHDHRHVAQSGHAQRH